MSTLSSSSVHTVQTESKILNYTNQNTKKNSTSNQDYYFSAFNQNGIENSDSQEGALKEYFKIDIEGNCDSDCQILLIPVEGNREPSYFAGKNFARVLSNGINKNF